MPMGGIIRRNGAKKSSENSLKNLNGCLYQSMFGTHDSKIATNKKIKSKSKSFAIKNEIITSPYYNLDELKVSLQEQLFRSAGIFSIIAKISDFNLSMFELKTLMTSWCETGSVSLTKPAS